MKKEKCLNLSLPRNASKFAAGRVSQFTGLMSLASGVAWLVYYLIADTQRR